MEIKAQLIIDDDESPYQLRLRLPKSTFCDIDYKYICFSLAKPMTPESLKEGVLVDRIGDLHKVLFRKIYDGSKEVELIFSGEGRFIKGTDYPEGLYLESEQGSFQEVVLDRPIRRVQHTDTLVKTYSPAFIPACSVTEGVALIDWPENFNFIGNLWNVDWMRRLLDRLGSTLSLSDSPQAWSLQYENVPLLNESFELSVTEGGVILRYRDLDGFNSGQAYLYQYILQLSLYGSLQCVELTGTPKFKYRGVHLDVVRHFFSAEKIAEWVDIFALFQYKQFHWHLTDDDGWRVESKLYPQLTSIGAKRGPNEALLPQMGTGLNTYEGFYSQQAIRSVVSRCTQLGIDVVPEMDIPGHARALLKSMPELVEQADVSKYRSVQHHDDNVLNPLYGSTGKVIEALVDEWCVLFPGSLFHVGADEVPDGAWRGSPSVIDWSEKAKEPVENVQGILMRNIESQLAASGKTMAGWEEVTDGGGTSTNTWVYSWQGIEAGKKAASAGHPVVMTPAQYCYLDLAVTNQLEDPGYYWAGFVPLETVYKYDPLEGIPTETAPNIQGIQMCLWSELIRTPEDAEYMWFPRLLAGSELGWKINTNQSFEVFLTSVKAWMPILSKLGLYVRSEKEGW